MATPEQMLINKIILTEGGMKRAVEWGITREDFRAKEVQSMWDTLYSEYTSPQHPGSGVGPLMGKHKFPAWDFGLVDPDVQLEHLCLEVRKYRVSSMIMEKASNIVQVAEYDPILSIGMLHDLVHQTQVIDTCKRTDVDFQEGMRKVTDRYHRAKEGGLIGKFPWPWDCIQSLTGGIQQDDYIVLYGRPKSKKTWVLTYLIYWAYRHRAKILFYTKEMTDENLYMRLAAFILEVIYDDLRLGKLSAKDEANLNKLLEESEKIKNTVVCLSAKDADGLDTVAWLSGKVEKYQPDVVFIDGMYLMSTETKRPLKDHERVQAISRAIRAMVLNTKVPVICTVQANRKAASHNEANLDEIAFSDSLSQDCTLAVRVIKDKDEPTISLIFGGNTREFDMPDFRIYAIPCTNFGFYGELNAKEAQKAKEADAEIEEKKPKRKKAETPTPSTSKAIADHLKNLEV